MSGMEYDGVLDEQASITPPDGKRHTVALSTARGDRRSARVGPEEEFEESMQHAVNLSAIAKLCHWEQPQ